MYDEAASYVDAISKSIQILENVEHWQTVDKTNVWKIDNCCLIQQTEDGYVRYANFLTAIFELRYRNSRGQYFQNEFPVF